MRTRPLPERKTLGTGWNLRPDTERVPARALQAGDVVLEDADHPVILTNVHGVRVLTLHAKYIWQPPHEPSWILGTFGSGHPFDRALPGEY